VRSVASREACGVVKGPARVGGSRECRAPDLRVKAMEGVEDLDVQAPKDSPALRCAERADSGGGNWGGPGPAGLRSVGACWSAALYNQ
jgi:hypothetical protein